MQKEARRILDDARTDVSGERCLLRVLDAITDSESHALSQLLMAGLNDMADCAVFSRNLLLHHVSRVASLRNLSDEKAEYVGYALASLAYSLWTTFSSDVACDDVNKALSRASLGHDMVLVGVTAYIEEALATLPSGNRQALLSCFRQFVLRTLGSPSTSPLAKQTVASAIVRLGWSVDSMSQRVFVVETLLRTVELLPIDSKVASTVLLSTVDLATSVVDSSVHVAIAVALLSRLPHVQAQRSGTLHLLLALESLLTAAPLVAWNDDSDVLGMVAFQLATVRTPVEQAVLLRVVRTLLNAVPDTTRSRHVYAEVLFAPLLQLLPASASHVQQLQHVTTQVPFEPCPMSTDDVMPSQSLSPHYPLVHLLSTMVRTAETTTIVAWLADAALQLSNTSNRPPYDVHVVLVNSALLFHPSPLVQDAAIATAKAGVLAWPAAGRVFVPCVVYVLASRPVSSEPVLALLHVLLASAKDSECMKTVLKTIKALADAPSTKPLALRLLYQVWTVESRVYPRLEEMLATPPEDDSVEWQVCHLYTILQLCQARGDLGLAFIATIQTSLEHALPSMVGMAVACVRALCVGDCLDYAAACKILATKQRKNKILRMDHPLYQEELCHLYGIGGTIVSGKPAFLDQLWAFATDRAAYSHPSVRAAAVRALTQFPLHWIGLKLVSSVDLTVAPSESEDHVVELAIDRLLHAMTHEPDADVRCALDALVKRVGEDEAMQPRKRFVAERTSGGASREMRNLLPTHPVLRQMYNDAVPLMMRQALAGAVLTSFVWTPPDDSTRKRKDKAVKAMEATWADATALRSQLRDEAGTSECNDEWPLRLAHIVSWEHFMTQYVALRHAKDAITRDDGGAEKLALDLVAAHSSNPNDYLMAGVLARSLPSDLHVLSNRIVEMVLRSLSLSLVQRSDAVVRDIDGPVHAIVALGVATQGALGLHEHLVDEVCDKLVGILHADNAELVPACLLSLGHVVQSLMLKQVAPSLMRRLFFTLVVHLVDAAVVRDAAVESTNDEALFQVQHLVVRSRPDKAILTATSTALALASEGCMACQHSEWLTGIRELLLALCEKGCSEVLTALPVVLLQCLQFELIGWPEVDAFVDVCAAAAGLNEGTEQLSPTPEALVALPYLLCRTQPLGHITSPDLPRQLLARLLDIAHDTSRQYDASARAYATFGLANMLGAGLAMDVRPTVWKGMLVSRIDAEKAIDCLTTSASLCAVQRVRIHAVWALGALSALGSSGDSFQLKNAGMDAGLQLPPSSATYKLLDMLRHVKQPTVADASWIASAFAGLSVCQVPTFHYATLVQRLWKARLGDNVARAALTFAFRHCVHDPSLLSFIVELAAAPRFRHLSIAVQAAFIEHVPALAKLVAPHQLHSILTNLLDVLSTHFDAIVDAIAMCATAAATPTVSAVCAEILLDCVFPRLAADVAMPAASPSSFAPFQAFTRAVFHVDRHLAKARFLDALRQHPETAHAAFVCMMELFRLGGCEPKEVRVATMPFLAGCDSADLVETIVVHASTSLTRLQPNDQLLWLMDLINWVGLKLSARTTPSSSTGHGLLTVLLGALCVRWCPDRAIQAQWLWLQNRVAHVAAVLPAAFVHVLSKLHVTVDARAADGLAAQLVVLVQQLSDSTHKGIESVYEAIVSYAYVATTNVRIDGVAFLEHFGI
ncbi:hypothetical protein H310_11191 [Aphanomyces invadans]|uniref:DUF3730 domain-containing protein n=1 Tax=Aphanomyces invadans TaxID=157072 RepID=A0A024TMB3_9STRA|nr:hypothetical protein H310_11191 [Aphanomyces invadans]ETV95290.1 hypothetical protein H310_11191 [Aphanomyces invadans]|eukprot:XP_008875991.1 hypothetical protein H310_11191 [Aphanomyces invadans]